MDIKYAYYSKFILNILKANFFQKMKKILSLLFLALIVAFRQIKQLIIKQYNIIATGTIVNETHTMLQSAKVLDICHGDSYNPIFEQITPYFYV